LDCLKIDQRINRRARCALVGFIRITSELGPPRSSPNSEPSVGGKRPSSDSSKVPAELVRQNATYHRYLQGSWNYSKENSLKEERDASGRCRQETQKWCPNKRTWYHGLWHACSKVSRATLRIARCPMLAKTALSSSLKTDAPIRAA
ncbi:hypothetical protein HHX47_DHR7000785, partial [Lentinula edodes]